MKSAIFSTRLSKKAMKFIDGIELGMLPPAAAEYAGYSDRDECNSLLKRPEIYAHVQKIRARTARKFKITREKVQEGLMDAIELARLQADATAMIRGYNEINKMMGYHAPEVKEHRLTLAQAEKMQKFNGMTDYELLELQQGVQLEGEFEELPPPKDN